MLGFDSTTNDILGGAAASARPSSWLRSKGWDYAVILLLILLVVSIRIRLRDYPLERDEGEYAYGGQLLLQGHAPYEVMYSMKLPGTYVAYAVIMAVFGQTPGGIHIGVTLVNAVSIFLLFLIARKLFDPTAAIVAGSTFGLFAMRPILMGLAGHATHFVVLSALASVFVLLKALESRKSRLFWWSGLLGGLAFLMKQPGIFFAVFAGLYILWHELAKPESRNKLWRELGFFSFGVLVPYAAMILILWRAGVLGRFWFWTVSYARAYSAELSVSSGLRHFAHGMAFQEDHVLVIWFLATLGLAAFLWDQKLRPHVQFTLGFVGFSFLALSAGLAFRPHYFIVLYPAVGILCGIGVSSAARLAQRVNKAKLPVAIPLLLFALAFGYAVYAEREMYFRDSADAVARIVYGDVPFPEAIKIGSFIKEHSARTARVAVLGSEPEILFYANRLSATGYIYTYPLMEDQVYAPAMKSEFVHEVETAQPEFLVSVMIVGSWFGRGTFDENFMHWADSYTRQHYSVVGIADGGNHDEFRWGPEALSYRPRRSTVILVYHRNL